MSVLLHSETFGQLDVKQIFHDWPLHDSIMLLHCALVAIHQSYTCEHNSFQGPCDNYMMNVITIQTLGRLNVFQDTLNTGIIIQQIKVEFYRDEGHISKVTKKWKRRNESRQQMLIEVNDSSCCVALTCAVGAEASQQLKANVSLHTHRAGMDLEDVCATLKTKKRRFQVSSLWVEELAFIQQKGTGGAYTEGKPMTIPDINRFLYHWLSEDILN